MPAPTTALFYPWIDIEDEAWLRTAALFWEEIRTVVPRSVRHPYRRHVSRWLAGEGVLKPQIVDPDDPVVRSLSGEVMEYLVSNEGRDLLMRPASPATIQLHDDSFSDSLRDVFLHRQKLPREVRHILERIRGVRGDWMQVEAGFGDFYMTMLANRLAEQHGLALITPSSASDRLAIAARSGRRDDVAYDDPTPRIPKRVTDGMAVDAVITGIRIDPDVPIQRLIDFRRTNSDDLNRFRTELAKLADSIPLDEPLPAVREHANNIWRTEVKPALAALKRALRANRIKYVAEGLLKVTFLSAAQASLLVTAGLSTSVALVVGGGVSVVAVSSLCAVDKDKVLRESPYTYLLNVEKQFQ